MKCLFYVVNYELIYNLDIHLLFCYLYLYFVFIISKIAGERKASLEAKAAEKEEEQEQQQDIWPPDAAASDDSDARYNDFKENSDSQQILSLTDSLC